MKDNAAPLRRVPPAQDFYGIDPDYLPVMVSADWNEFVPIEQVPVETVTRISALIEHFRNLNAEDPFAFGVVVGLVSAAMNPFGPPDLE